MRMESMRARSSMSAGFSKLTMMIRYSPESRSEERRVGEEGRSWGAPDHLKKKNTNTSVVGSPTTTTHRHLSPTLITTPHLCPFSTPPTVTHQPRRYLLWPPMYDRQRGEQGP